MRVLIFISDTGAGHRSVAEAIRGELHTQTNGRVECQVVDFFAEFHVPILRHAPRAYAWLTANALWFYDALFVISNNVVVNRCMSWMLSRVVRHRLIEFLEQSRPDVVISAHPLYVSDALVAARGKTTDFLILSVVSDLVSPHRSWACPSVDMCFAPNSTVGDMMIRLGVPRDRVEVSGFPVRKEFLEFHSKALVLDLRRKLSLGVDSLVVLLSGGGNGAGRIYSITKSLLGFGRGLQVVVLAGRNHRLARRIEKNNRESVIVAPSDGNVLDYMIASDLIVGKAGPSTIMESAAVGRPIFLTKEVGRQEQGNIALAKQMGVGAGVFDGRNLEYALLNFTSVSFDLNAPAEALLGARNIAKFVIGHVEAQ
ncbi:hypothetical protein OHA74_23280 [Streptomyces phaeochromogenes]|uniref:MGDG synthase family glycosyltransferase n=1 Tax=Streptomyces phaeochromogenes TaxID=1923 RepID=UPI002E29C23E|nr:glycosyltransferase [Streptomyces phaeochromogenes]